MFGRRPFPSEPRRRDRRVRPRVEALEDRCVPATFTPFFSTGLPDGRMALATQPASPGQLEIEAADDFVTPNATVSPTSTQPANSIIDGASFIGLVPFGTTQRELQKMVKDVTIEIYGVFPVASNTTRTPNVPTRTNSPSDVALLSDSSVAHELKFSTTILNTSFTAANSVLNGIHPLPTVTTGGDGAVLGEEVQFNVSLTKPFDLPPGHFFFVPQVQLSKGNFFWLSTPHPVDGGGTPFTPDLQAWIRNEPLQPDWLRVGTDIVGGGATAPQFNAAFTLYGEAAVQPHLLAVSPTSVSAGKTVTLTISGTNFTAESLVYVNGIAVQTTFDSASQLKAKVPGSLLKRGTVSLTASNPGIFSDNSLTLDVT